MLPDEWPLMLYRPGDMLEWDGERFDYRIVADAEEASAAMDEGWSLGKVPPAKPKKAAK